MRTTPNGTKRSSTPLLARARIRYIRTVSYCTRVDDDAPRSRSLLQRPEVREDLIVGHVLDGFASIASRPPRVGRCRSSSTLDRRLWLEPRRKLRVVAVAVAVDVAKGLGRRLEPGRRALIDDDVLRRLKVQAEIVVVDISRDAALPGRELPPPRSSLVAPRLSVRRRAAAAGTNRYRSPFREPRLVASMRDVFDVVGRERGPPRLRDRVPDRAHRIFRRLVHLESVREEPFDAVDLARVGGGARAPRATSRRLRTHPVVEQEPQQLHASAPRGELEHAVHGDERVALGEEMFDDEDVTALRGAREGLFVASG
eukprot:3620-Pelagococcus_subviridis.AAC.2